MSIYIYLNDESSINVEMTYEELIEKVCDENQELRNELVLIKREERGPLYINPTHISSVRVIEK